MTRIAVLGAGEVGAGWAALAAAHGRDVALYDPDRRALEQGEASTRARAARLVEHGLADERKARAGLDGLQVSATLADAVRRADWVIEAAPESLDIKQAVLAAAEAATDAGTTAGAMLASSSSGLHASALGGALRRPERLLVMHPLVPVELIPVVEVIPGPATDPLVTEAARRELAALGRVPVVLRREVTGNAVGRIAAAVWRECVDLVLDGILDTADADRLIAEGPCIGWASGGPLLTCELAADGGTREFLDHLLPTFEAWSAALSSRTSLPAAERARLTALVEETYGGSRADWRAERDARLIELVKALR